MRRTSIGVLFLWTAAGWQGSFAQERYPARPLRMIVTVAAGAPTDLFLRSLGQELQPRLGQPLVIDNRTTDITAAIEWASHQGMMRMGYAYSKFDQAIPSFTFDNPLYATDFNVFSKVLGVSYDPSGYSNGNGPATGRMALAPDPRSAGVVPSTKGSL